MEAEREVVDDWQSYLESKTLSRQKRRRALKIAVIAGIILLLLLLLSRCDYSTAPKATLPVANRALPASDSVYQSLGDLRPNFVQTQAEKASWAEELFVEMQARRKWLLTCVEDGNFPAFTWHFSYQPQIGELLHREFIWDNKETEPPYPLRACLQKYLERDFMPSEPQVGQWYRLSIHYSDEVGQIAQPAREPSEAN